jgi:RNA polymerase primary sigma factor
MERKDILQRKRDFVAKYAQYWNVPLIPNEQLRELLSRAQKGDAEAEDTIVRSMMRFVVSVAKQYDDKGLSDDELVEAGKKGLVIAIPKYDRSRGFRFISYAVWFVRNSILQAIEDKFKS